MKLIFSKDANNDINVLLQKGTVAEDFTYTEMVRQLLLDSNFDDSEFVDLSDEEQAKIKSMLEKISAVFKDDDKEDQKAEAEEGF